MVGDFGWEHEGTECQVDTVNVGIVTQRMEPHPVSFIIQGALY